MKLMIGDAVKRERERAGMALVVTRALAGDERRREAMRRKPAPAAGPRDALHVGL